MFCGIVFGEGSDAVAYPAYIKMALHRRLICSHSSSDPITEAFVERLRVIITLGRYMTREKPSKLAFCALQVQEQTVPDIGVRGFSDATRKLQ